MEMEKETRADLFKKKREFYMFRLLFITVLLCSFGHLVVLVRHTQYNTIGPRNLQFCTRFQIQMQWLT